MERSNFDMVGDFHEKFGLDNATHHPVGLRHPDIPLLQFRLEFIKEEVMELVTALEAGDLPGVADSLIDLAYVTMGFGHVLGLPWQELFEEVQRANMAKERCLREEDSTRGSTYDVVKPEGWEPPDITGVLLRNGFDS